MQEGLVRASNVNLRKTPKTGKVIRQIRKGSKIEVLGQEVWYLVRTSKGEVGYLLGDFVDKEIDPAASAPVVEAAADRDEETTLSPVAELAVYHNDRFQGGKEVVADRDFFPHLDRVNQFAEQAGVWIHVTSSTREPNRSVTGAIVPPARRSNHMVGHAIDMNLRTADAFFNSKALRKSNFANLPPNVRTFLQSLRDDPVLVWGGDFSTEDPVHIDDRLNTRVPDVFDSKLASRQG